MRLDKIVWVELEGEKHDRCVRIFRNRKDALASTVFIAEWLRKVAVASIRHQIFLRGKGVCEAVLCDSLVTETSGHMHEQKHRGESGEISLDNSIFICAKTHKQAHLDRNPRWSRHDSN